MRILSPARWMSLTVLSLVALGAITAMAATNSVSATHVGLTNHPVMLQQLVPSECSGISGSLDQLVVGSGLILGSNQSELILGGAGNDTILGLQGDDCIVAGAGDDSVNGNMRNDVLLGGSGDDDLDGGMGNDDWCYGGPGTDSSARCETEFGIP